LNKKLGATRVVKSLLPSNCGTKIAPKPTVVSAEAAMQENASKASDVSAVWCLFITAAFSWRFLYVLIVTFVRALWITVYARVC
jgi:hypothetical protein